MDTQKAAYDWMEDEDQVAKIMKTYASGLEHFHKGQKAKGRRLMASAVEQLNQFTKEIS
jgi:hypothetical protein